MLSMSVVTLSLVPVLPTGAGAGFAQACGVSSYQ